MNQLKRLAAFGVGALLLGGCGGGGGASSPASVADFVPFFAAVYATPAQPSDPVPLAGVVFVNQFPEDENTFSFLLD